MVKTGGFTGKLSSREQRNEHSDKIFDEPRHFRLISCSICPTDAVCYGISPLAPKVFPATKQLVQRPPIKGKKERKETATLTVR